MTTLACFVATAGRADYVGGLNPRGDNFLSFRGGPGGAWPEIGRLGPDTAVTVIGREGVWRKVRLRDGRVGWVHGGFVRAGEPPSAGARAERGPATAGPRVIVTGLNPRGDNFLSFRAGPGGAFPEIGRLGPNTAGVVLERKAPWARIRLTDGRVGWVHAGFLKAAESLPPVAAATRLPPVEVAREVPARPSAEVAARPPPRPEVRIEPRPEITPPAEKAVRVEPPPPVPDPVASIPPAAPGRRVALVIGNSAYVQAPALQNPVHDAGDVAAAFRDLGFEVIERRDLDAAGMTEAMSEFSRKIAGAETALLFYAGHGVQLNGRNYLVPVDAKFASALDVELRGLDLNAPIREMERQTRTSLIFLDACRDNPFAAALGAGTRSLASRGLARIEGGAGTLIAFATAPDQTALDGSGRNSPFTGALLKHVKTPGLEVRQMLTRVRAEVMTVTGKQQVPWDSSSLTGDVYLASR